MWSVLFGFFLVSISAANISEIDENFFSEWIEIFKFCWSNRKTPGFTEERHYFNLERFPEDSLSEKMEKWSLRRLPLKSLNLSWPFDKTINGTKNTYSVRDLFYRKDGFTAAIHLGLPCSTFVASKIGLSTAHLSVLHDHVPSLQMLLKLHPSLAKAAIKMTETTPLHFAVLLKSYKCMEILLKAGVSCFVADKQGNSPVDLVLIKGDFKALNLFILFGKILHHPALKKTAAYFIHAGKFRHAVLLIAHGADSNIYDPASEATLLQLAFKLNDQLGIQILQMHLADTSVAVHATIHGDLVALEKVSIISKARNYNGKCLLELATLAKNSDTFQLLLNSVPRLRNFSRSSRELKQIALSAATNGFIPALDFAFSKGFLPNEKLGRSCLLGHALESGQFAAVDWMIKVHNAIILDVHYNSLPILVHALFTRNQGLMKYLIPQFKPLIEVNFLIFPLGFRALNFLISANDFEGFYWLLQQGANPNLPDFYGITAKSIAIAHQDSDFQIKFSELCKKLNF